jgi:mRNA interferase RelE/StbE
VEILPSAQRELASLPSSEQKRINERIGRLATVPRPPGITVLQGKKDTYYRLRVGDYRIIYQIQDKALVVLVIKIGHRREVYRKR